MLSIEIDSRRRLIHYLRRLRCATEAMGRSIGAMIPRGKRWAVPQGDSLDQFHSTGSLLASSYSEGGKHHHNIAGCRGVNTCDNLTILSGLFAIMVKRRKYEEEQPEKLAVKR